MLAGLMVIEVAQWHMTRQVLSVALLEAARVGATAHGNPGLIERTFENALVPLFQPTGAYPHPQARMQATFRALTQRTKLLPWRIEVLQPADTAFADFTDTTLQVPQARGRRIIRNDYQAEHHLYRQKMGWHQGRGPRSGLTIFDANTLHLRLTYLHQPLTPGARKILQWLGSIPQTHTETAQFGLLKIVLNMTLTMQSHPVDWLSATSRFKPTDPRRPQTTQPAQTKPFKHMRQRDPLDPPASSAIGPTVNAYLAAAQPFIHLPQPLLLPQAPEATFLPPPSSNSPPAEGCGVVLCCAAPVT
jgi:hypothetical protein